MKTTTTLPNTLRQPLQRLRRRWRMVALGEGVALLVLAVFVLTVTQTALDWWFDIPWLGRLGLLAADAAVLAWIYWFRLHRPLRRRLDLARTALLVEKKWTSLRQCLITAVELGEGTRFSSQGSATLAGQVFEWARLRLQPLNLDEVAPARRLKRWALAAGAAAVLALGLGAWTLPESAVLVARLLLSRQPLPTKTIVEPLTRDLVLAAGGEVELKARARGVVPSRGRVLLSYERGAAQEVSLSAGDDGVFAHTVGNLQQGFRYAFYLGDGRSPQFTVTVRVPPVVSGLELEQVYPAYTKLPPQRRVPSDLSLLAGSRLRVKVASTSKLGAAEVLLQGLPDNAELKLDAARTGAGGEVLVPAKDLTGLAVRLVDEAGVRSVNETVYPVAVVPDLPPQVSLSEPLEERMTVTLRARPAVVFTAADDFGLARLSVAYQVQAPAVAGQELSDPSAVQHIAVKINEAGTAYRCEVDLAKLAPPVSEGWTVTWWVEAQDNNDVTGPGITRTERRQWAVVSPEEKQAEIYERLRQNAEALDNLSHKQDKISNEVGETIQKK